MSSTSSQAHIIFSFTISIIIGLYFWYKSTLAIPKEIRPISLIIFILSPLLLWNIFYILFKLYKILSNNVVFLLYSLLLLILHSGFPIDDIINKYERKDIYDVLSYYHEELKEYLNKIVR